MTSGPAGGVLRDTGLVCHVTSGPAGGSVPTEEHTRQIKQFSPDHRQHLEKYGIPSYNKSESKKKKTPVASFPKIIVGCIFC